MRINVTEQTTTFPCPKGDLKNQLNKNDGLTWKTEHGEFQINDYTVPWILENVKTIIYALVIALIIRTFLFQPFYIPSSSMEPNLLVGDR